MADKVIEELTVKQKQKRDAEANKPFDREMDAYRRGKDNLTDEERIDRLKDNADLRNRLYQSIGFEMGAGAVVDAVTTPLMVAPPVYAGVNFVAGSAINTLAQLWRQDDNFSWGEVGASGALGVVPGLGGKGAVGVAKAVGKGADSGVAHEAIRIGIDEQRLPTAEEAVVGGTIGGVIGGGVKVGADVTNVVGHRLIRRIEGNPRWYPLTNRLSPIEGTVGAMKRGELGDFDIVKPRKGIDDIDADKLDEALYNDQFNEFVSFELGYDPSKVSEKIYRPRVKAKDGTQMPPEIGTPFVRHGEAFLANNKNATLQEFPLIKWKKEYWALKNRSGVIGIESWEARKTREKIGKAKRRRLTLEQSEGVPPGTLAKEKTRQLIEFNERREKVGLKPLNMSEVEMDHVNALNAYDMYTKDLPPSFRKEFKELLENEVLTTGDNVGNLKLREKTIHRGLWPALERRLKALGHKRSGFKSPEAQMEYYKSINPKTGVTRVEEFAEAVHYIDEKGTDLMENLLIVADQPQPAKGFPKIKLKKSSKDLLIEIFGKGDLEEGQAAYRKFMDELRDVPENVREEFILEEIKNAGR